jgi:hypothetical protein
MATKETASRHRPERLVTQRMRPRPGVPNTRAWCLLLGLFAACELAGEGAFAASNSPVRQARYGAIAFDRDTRAVGYSYDFVASRNAKLEALKQCAGGNCEVVVAFRNGCGAVGDGKTKLWTATGVTRQEAQTKILRQCGKDCPILAWACTR